MKRACPYDANLLNMAKVHLMDHDVDILALQKVHDITLKKLRDGARLPAKIVEAEVKEPISEAQRSKSKQLELTQFFKNANPSPVFHFRAKAENKNQTTAEETSSCSFCDKKGATFPCIGCADYFCNSCSLKRYNGADETCICLTCS